MASPVTEAAQRIFADLADPQAVNRDADGAWKAPLWRALEEAGLTLAWVPEALGGAGARLAEGFEVLAAAGRYALAAPLAETLLAGWLLARGGLAAPAGMMSVAPAQPGEPIRLDPDGALRGRARAVPFAPDVAHFAVLAQGASGAHVALVEARACKVDAGKNLAGDSLGNVSFDGTKVLSPASVDLDPTELLLMGCTARAVQSAGALEALLEAALRYAGERVAFERPIGRFQAVQHNLARLAGEASAALAASSSAADAMERAERLVERTERFDEGVFLETAAAKIRCAEAAYEGAAIAHQVFGALGYSQEHILHRFTLRLLAWREDFGNESLWAAELGRRVAARGADELWPLVAAR
jgi:acyl-CoA dehydrogenase